MTAILKMLLLCMLYYFLYHCNLVIHLKILQILSYAIYSHKSYILPIFCFNPPKYILAILYTIDIMVQYKSENK